MHPHYALGSFAEHVKVKKEAHSIAAHGQQPMRPSSLSAMACLRFAVGWSLKTRQLSAIALPFKKG
ncbi:hypothetical protein C7B82_06245 [Stenomitos frigidus ULC18]|uniref:Uncharacterized protein n=1 Tax=Stenomitos frigidus ULC18 TaxID=2107698 RepID=A0A2T1EGJ9_9CYAN|nr:hypothetical protein C7B82_06245 [Stenomitos frigidus ULC18]